MPPARTIPTVSGKLSQWAFSVWLAAIDQDVDRYVIKAERKGWAVTWYRAHLLAAPRIELGMVDAAPDAPDQGPARRVIDLLALRASEPWQLVRLDNDLLPELVRAFTSAPGDLRHGAVGVETLRSFLAQHCGEWLDTVQPDWLAELVTP